MYCVYYKALYVLTCVIISRHWPSDRPAGGGLPCPLTPAVCPHHSSYCQPHPRHLQAVTWWGQGTSPPYVAIFMWLTAVNHHFTNVVWLSAWSTYRSKLCYLWAVIVVHLKNKLKTKIAECWYFKRITALIYLCLVTVKMQTSGQMTWYALTCCQMQFVSAKMEVLKLTSIFAHSHAVTYLSLVAMNVSTTHKHGH